MVSLPAGKGGLFYFMITISNSLGVVAAALAVLLGLAAVVRKRASLASWSFCLGMMVLATETVLGGLSLSAAEPRGGLAGWHAASLIASALVPGCWLTFSLTFCRGNSRDFLQRWRWALVLAFLVPAGIVFGGKAQLVRLVEGPEAGDILLGNGPAAKALTVLGIVGAILVLTNVEKTFRAAVGTTRWRVKYMVLGIGVLFGTRIYTLSQALLFPIHNPTMTVVDAGALLIGSALMAVGYSRRGLADLEVYPSRAVLQQSVTVMVAGAYLFLIGVFAELVAFLGGPNAFPAQAFIVLLGIAGLSALLLSDRFRLSMQRFVTRHFKRPEHDFRKVWSKFSQGLSGVTGGEALCSKASRLIAETFDVLSVTTLLMDRHSEQLKVATSTSRTGETPLIPELDAPASALVAEGMRAIPHPFDLDKSGAPWAEPIRAMTPKQFDHGGNRIAVRLMAGDQWLGLLVLADRVNGIPYTQEELDLLECIAEELGARLLNQNLGDELIQSREMEAFQAMSAFFVHDMKNAASSLNLTLQNLPKHYDNPEFREDALRGLAKTADRICQLTDRLGTLRRNLAPTLVESDLNQIVEAALSELGKPAPSGVELVKELTALPKVMADPEQMRSVVTNLVLNAREALGAEGKVQIRTRRVGDRVQLSVEDNGCGMTEAFIRTSLFRPFHSTKKQGLGIGMFQSRMIIEAHRGTLQVESEPSRGTTFRIHLPLAA